MSDTPRTDAALGPIGRIVHTDVKLVALARELERENTLLKAKMQGYDRMCAQGVYYTTEQAAALIKAADEGRADRERLDWLETQDCWIGVYGEYDINARIQAGGNYSQKLRAAVDAARRGESV